MRTHNIEKLLNDNKKLNEENKELKEEIRN